MSVTPEYAIQRAVKRLDKLIDQVLKLDSVESRSLARVLSDIRSGLTPQATGADLEEATGVGRG